MDPYPGGLSAHAEAETHVVRAAEQQVQQQVEQGKHEEMVDEEMKDDDRPKKMVEDDKRPRPRPKKAYGMEMDIPTPTIFEMLSEPSMPHQATGYPAANGYEQRAYDPQQEQDKSMEMPPPPPPAPVPTDDAAGVVPDYGVPMPDQNEPDDHQPQDLQVEHQQTQQTMVHQYVKSGVEVKIHSESGETVPLEKIMDLKMEAPANGEIPMCTLKANAQHPDWFQNQLAYALTTGMCYDAVWQCDGGMFRVHKFVLAAFSEGLKAMLPDDELRTVICTPDLPKNMVKAMLCIMYTGQARIPWESLQEINNGFKLIGFSGKDLSADPHCVTNENELMINYAAAQDRLASLEFTPIVLNNVEVSHFKFQPKQDPEEFDDSCRVKQEPKKVIKIEMEEDKEEEEPQPKYSASQNYYDQRFFDEDEEYYEPAYKKPRSTRGRKPKKYKKDTLDGFINDDDADEPYDDLTPVKVERRGRPKGSGKKEKVDKETRTTYPLNRNRGNLSKRLAYDLFDDPEKARKVKSITVCPICFKLFDDRDKMRDHKIMQHNTDVKNSMIINKTTYQCKKCEKTLELKHLVWFVKHYKYCGKDDIKANEVLGLDDIEECSPMDDPLPIHKNSRDIDVMYVNDRPKLMNISRALLGKVAETIWGCRKCYGAFETEDEYNDHINTAHDGKIEHGTCYDHEQKCYSCKNCKVFRTAKSIHYFMYHLKKCNVDVQGVVPIDDEEDVDEDTYYEFVDPWGIVNKPLKIRTQRSKWICESLFGQLYAMLFPCHLCYNVFKSEEEVREHFRVTHPGLQNFMEHGPHFNKENGSFTCPYCKREVCKKQRNSIYFTYHMRKCDNKLYTVTRTCNKCQKTFSSFRSLQFHIQTKCGTVDSVCHICGMVIKTLDGLQKHVMITHSDARPYPCKVCNKAFKRAPDLDYHMKLHMGSLDWSCETCGKAFPLKKNLKIHMTTHLAEADKPHVCHICGNRFARKPFLVNHLTTHSSFRGFSCEVCNAQVKTKDSLKQHRRKVHKLYTPIPESCILEPEPNSMDYMKLHPKMSAHNNKKRKRPPFIPGMLGAHHDPNVQVKEEVLPMLGEGMEGHGILGQ